MSQVEPNQAELNNDEVVKISQTKQNWIAISQWSGIISQIEFGSSQTELELELE